MESAADEDSLSVADSNANARIKFGYVVACRSISWHVVACRWKCNENSIKNGICQILRTKLQDCSGVCGHFSLSNFK